MKKLFLWALSALLTLPAAAQDFVPEASFYGENYWTPDTLGNHRAIVSVNTPASVAEAYIPWRRRDSQSRTKRDYCDQCIYRQSGRQCTSGGNQP